MSYYAVIMAGGTGTRLWPMSRRATPKQSLRLIGERTMFQSAIDRVAPLLGLDRIVVVTGPAQAPELARQVPELPPESFLIEPAPRGTAACIALAAVYIRRLAPEAVMAVLTADQVISEVARFQSVLTVAREVALGGSLVTLGITPSTASTGYGYIEAAEPVGSDQGFTWYRANQFTEKPDAATAARFVASGRYSWNSGMFIWRVDRILEEYRRQMPRLWELVDRIGSDEDFPPVGQELVREWLELRKQTIDYGIMEHAQDIVVIPCAIGWSDVGSWSSLAELLPADEAGNVVIGNHVGTDTRDTLVIGGRRLIATVGLENVVIVDTEDALLVCDREREQGVREIVRMLEQDGRTQYL